MSDEKLELLQQMGAPVGRSAFPDPLAPEFAVTEADREASKVNTQPWQRSGAWRHRQFGDELQLRSAGLPHLLLDLYRSEAEDLYVALGAVLSKPVELPFHLSRWQRIKHWWLRAVWKRRHYAELKAATAEHLQFFSRKGPWG